MQPLITKDEMSFVSRISTMLFSEELHKYFNLHENEIKEVEEACVQVFDQLERQQFFAALEPEFEKIGQDTEDKTKLTCSLVDNKFGVFSEQYNLFNKAKQDALTQALKDIEEREKSAQAETEEHVWLPETEVSDASNEQRSDEAQRYSDEIEDPEKYEKFVMTMWLGAN